MPKRRVKRHPVTQPLKESYRFVPLTRGQNAIVDVEDFEWLNQANWQAKWDPCTRGFYVSGKYNGRCVLMHRLILNCDPSVQVDHANGNSLDNRKNNIRIATQQDNKKNKKRYRSNKSGFKGVYWHKIMRRWSVLIGVSGKQIHLGYFEKPKDGARAYDEAAKHHFGEFAHLNFS